MCKTSSSLFALQGEQILLRRLLPLPLPPLLLTSPCKRWWVKASTQSRDCGVWVVLGGAFWFVFFLSSRGCIYIPSFLLAPSQPSCCALSQCMNRHWNELLKGHTPIAVMGNLGLKFQATFLLVSVRG